MVPGALGNANHSRRRWERDEEHAEELVGFPSTADGEGVISERSDGGEAGSLGPELQRLGGLDAVVDSGEGGAEPKGGSG